MKKDITRSKIGLFATMAALFAGNKPSRSTVDLPGFSIVPRHHHNRNRGQTKCGIPGSKLGRKMRRRTRKGGWFQSFDKTPLDREDRNKQRRKLSARIVQKCHDDAKAFQRQREADIRYKRTRVHA